MPRSLIYLAISCVLCFNFSNVPANSQATNLRTKTQFIEGKHFKRIHVSGLEKLPQNKVEVMHFFSLGCPWCAHLDPALTEWAQYLPPFVAFRRVHVTFDSVSGRKAAKIFYTAQALKLTPVINSKLFELIQSKAVLNETTLAKFFSNYAINKEKFLATFHFSTRLNTLLLRDESVMRHYCVVTIPAIVVNRQYQVDLAMASGDVSQFLDIVNYLIHRSKQLLLE